MQQQTPLKMAQQFKHRDIAQMLLEAGATLWQLWQIISLLAIEKTAFHQSLKDAVYTPERSPKYYHHSSSTAEMPDSDACTDICHVSTANSVDSIWSAPFSMPKHYDSLQTCPTMMIVWGAATFLPPIVWTAFDEALTACLNTFLDPLPKCRTGSSYKELPHFYCQLL